MHYLGRREANGRHDGSLPSLRTVGAGVGDLVVGLCLLSAGAARCWGLIQLNAHKSGCVSDLH